MKFNYLNLDLDLHIEVETETPEKMYHISYRNKMCGGGQLDVDMNASSPYSTMPVENIFFARAKPGRYRVFVNNFAFRPDKQNDPAKKTKLSKTEEQKKTR